MILWKGQDLFQNMLNLETYSFIYSFNPKFSCMFFNRFPFFLTQVI